MGVRERRSEKETTCLEALLMFELRFLRMNDASLHLTQLLPQQLNLQREYKYNESGRDKHMAVAVVVVGVVMVAYLANRLCRQSSLRALLLLNVRERV